MRPAVFAIALVLLAVLAGGAPRPQAAASLKIEPLIWQFNRDYPGANGDDRQLPIHTVYIKTHDRTDWMSTYDDHPSAVSGPEQLRNLIQHYAFQGIDVVAWFNPAGLDVEGQLQRAREVIDSGVKGLYADVEPFAGFCNDDCAYLADNFWARLRQERPQARLGVMYDPRAWHHERSALDKWLANADVALPQCYWETFAGQEPYDSPRGCIFRAYQDLPSLAPGRQLEFVPILQGATSGPRFREALDTSLAVGSTRVAVWRRGITTGEVWDETRRYLGEFTRPCWVTRSDNCLIREEGDTATWLIQGGARFFVPDGGGPISTAELTFRGTPVHIVPRGFVATLPTVPRDGTLLQEEDGPEVWVVYTGAKFWIPSPEDFGAMGFDWGAVRLVPAGGASHIPGVAPPYTRVREFNDGQEWVMIPPGRVALDDGKRARLLAAGRGEPLYVLPRGSLASLPVNQPVHGDGSCNGAVDAVDALLALRDVAGMPNLGLCLPEVGDTDCSGQLSSVDALILLRHLAGLTISPAEGCPVPGDPPGGEQPEPPLDG
jgi:hypothetical protein